MARAPRRLRRLSSQRNHFEAVMTSDAFPHPEDAFAIWDNIHDEYYADDYGKVLTYPTKEEAEAGLLEDRRVVANKENKE